jgi:hypothetical protein
LRTDDRKHVGCPQPEDIAWTAGMSLCFLVLMNGNNSQLTNNMPLVSFWLLSTQFKAVFFAVELDMSALALQGPMANRQLDPLQKPAQYVPFMGLVQLLDLAFHPKYKRLIDDNILWLGS